MMEKLQWLAGLMVSKLYYKNSIKQKYIFIVLNLAICSACEISNIRNAINIIETVYNFMNTPKRQCVVQDG